MEIIGGFMVMMSIIGLFLAIVWLIMPFVVFAMKSKQDHSLELLEKIEKRLTLIEQQLTQFHPGHTSEIKPFETPADDSLSASGNDIPPQVLPLA